MTPKTLRASGAPDCVPAPLLRALPEGVAARALAAALEAIAGVACVVSPAGEVVATNRLGCEVLQHLAGPRPGDLLAYVRRQESARVVPLGEAGEARHWFLAYRDPVDLEARLRRVSARWGLTPRQAEVLRHLVAGEANKVIAQRLGCAEATVELHITRILAGAGVDSRARAIARFYQGE